MTTIPTIPVRLFLVLAILCACIGCDQVTKSIAAKTLVGLPTQSFAGDTLRFEYALNPGGFLSLGSSLSQELRKWIFVGLNSSMMLGLTLFLIVKRRISVMILVALALILAGGIGNLIDRISNNGLVTDFINVGIGPLRTGVFNVADMAVLFGVLALGYLSIYTHEDKAISDHIEKT